MSKYTEEHWYADTRHRAFQPLCRAPFGAGARTVASVTCRKCQVIIRQYHPNKTLAQLFRHVA